MKKCSRCKVERPLVEFGKNAKTRDGLQAWCRECFRDYARQWYGPNRSRILADKKVQYARKRHGQT